MKTLELSAVCRSACNDTRVDSFASRFGGAWNVTAHDDSYIDEKGRTRWRCNDELARRLSQLYDLLVIGNYEESHASRYPRLAHTISRYPESIRTLQAEGRLSEIRGIAGVITNIVTELLENGTCRKMEVGDEYFTPPPRTVLELTEIPRIGAKTARMLYQDFGIDSLAKLERALRRGQLADVKGIGKGTIATIRKHLEARRNCAEQSEGLE